MKRTAIVLVVFWALTFGLVPTALALAGLDFTQPDTWPSAWWGVFAVAALVADIVLAVPTGVIIAALGGAYGFWWGSALGLLGSAGATLVGWTLGRMGSSLVSTIPENDPVRGALERWGVAALIATRPIPVVAESAALVAGSGGLSPSKAVAAAVIGGVPTAALYAAVGASAQAMEAPVWVPLAAALGLGLLAWVAGMLIGRGATPTPDPVG